MAYLDAMIGIVVLMAISLWIVSKIGDGPSIATHLVAPVLREPPARNREVEAPPWRWDSPPPGAPAAPRRDDPRDGAATG